MNTHTILSESAIVFDAQGYVQQSGVQVADFGDFITIGETEHTKDALTITADTIESVHGWMVKL